MIDNVNFSMLLESFNNSPDVLYDILRSLGYCVEIEEYKHEFQVPIYEDKVVRKSRLVSKPTFFGCFGVTTHTEYYNDTEKVFVRYDTKYEMRKRLILKKIGGSNNG